MRVLMINIVKEAYNVDLKVGDTILIGRFKNVKTKVKGFGTNEKGQPTVVTDKGILSIALGFQIPFGPTRVIVFPRKSKPFWSMPLGSTSP